jgi:hypothetical protein
MEKISQYNAGINVKELIENLPAGLDRAMLRVLDFHIGRDSAISRGRLVADLGRMGFMVHEREARACINQLRKEGVAICSTGGGEGGYWLAADQEELEEFLEREFDARAMDLHEQARAMRQAAEKRWGRYSPEKQATLF